MDNPNSKEVNLEVNFQDSLNLIEGGLKDPYLGTNNDSNEFYDNINLMNKQQSSQPTELNKAQKENQKNVEKVNKSEIDSKNLTTESSEKSAETFGLLNVVNTQKESQISIIQPKPENIFDLKKSFDGDEKNEESKPAQTIENIEESKKEFPIQITSHTEDIKLIPKNLQNKVSSSNQKEEKKEVLIPLLRFRKLLEKKTKLSMAKLFKDRPSITDEKFFEVLRVNRRGHLEEEIKIALAEARRKYKKK